MYSTVKKKAISRHFQRSFLFIPCYTAHTLLKYPSETFKMMAETWPKATATLFNHNQLTKWYT